MTMNWRFVVTGGPGGGKSTLLDALAERGYRIAPEAARRLIKERLAAGLPPRPDPVTFARAILDSDMEHYRAAADDDGIAFFDRGVLDALYMLDLESALSRDEIASLIQAFPYNDTVFLLPPWEAIYAMDSERDQTFEESVAVFEGMKRWYARWGYQTVEVPRASVEARVSFILDAIGRQSV
ncbi:MAG: AAA family ATPase [Alloalcanivorax venustensis]|uniref:AAA family ATPase n=1 Tax=Alloalcanivorax venustensis TaxID=172371 RepID=UPI0030029575